MPFLDHFYSLLMPGGIYTCAMYLVLGDPKFCVTELTGGYYLFSLREELKFYVWIWHSGGRASWFMYEFDIQGAVHRDLFL